MCVCMHEGGAQVPSSLIDPAAGLQAKPLQGLYPALFPPPDCLSQIHPRQPSLWVGQTE